MIRRVIYRGIKMKKLILMVEDNEEIQLGNKRMFELEDYEVIAALTLEAARKSIDHRRPDIIILDILLPDGNGIEYMEELKLSENVDIPIILLTGLATKEDILSGFRAGGDDYLTKPFDFDVLLARVESLLRRTETIPGIIRKGQLTLKLTPRDAYLNDKNLTLTPKDFTLLLYFAQNENKILSAEQIYESVWGQPLTGDTQALIKAVSRLRQKLKGSGYTISVEYGTGYCFERGEP